METREFERETRSGWIMLGALAIAGLAIGGGWYWSSHQRGTVGYWTAGFVSVVWFVLLFGFFTLQPNIAGVLTLFGKYVGTVRRAGFHWANPFLVVRRVSLRAHNLNGAKLKVNDLRGSPIEIALVMVWRVVDTVKATFDVEAFADYVAVQSEAAMRHLAMSYPYDTFEGDTLSLRGSVDEVSKTLQKEVQERVSRAGVLVEETRISHLAYAPEIASAMLQRQQAEAIVAARSRIVDGAVGMCEMALAKLREHKTLELDEERKAAMVTNLLVVLCAHAPAQPVVNTGTLYT